MKYIIVLLLILNVSLTEAQNVVSVAGIAGVVGSANGPVGSSTFNNPHGIACDDQGNIYVANRYGNTIRKISNIGIVSTFAGSGSPGGNDGTGTAASFNEPWAVSCDTLGNVYVADTKNYKIRKITSTGTVTTISGTGTFGVTNGPVNVAEFGFPTGIAVSKDGNTIYVSDRMTHTIRKINAGMVSTLAGVVYLNGDIDGLGTIAKFDHPYSIALDNTGNILVADEYNNKIRKVTPAGMVSTVAGNGTMGSSNGAALSASFNAPWGICADINGDIFVGDANNFTVRKISGGIVSTYAGQNGIPGSVNGPALSSSFNGPSALWYNASENTIYLCDPFSQLIRKITPGALQTLAISTTTGNLSFCNGSSVTVISNPVTYNSYSFYEGATLLGTSTNGTLTISNLTTGQHDITCIATNQNGVPIISNTLIVTINPVLQVSIIAQGNTTICNGDTLVLSSSITGNYLWSTNANTATINVTNPGSYSLTVTNAQGCSGQSSPIQVFTLQPPAPTITTSGQTPVCPGDSVQLISGSAATYLWSNGDTSQTTYVTSQGNYTVQVSNGSGCSALSTPLAVNFYAVTNSSVAPGGTIMLVQGGTVTLVANSGTGYQWSTGELTQSVIINSPGTYTVTVTDANGCKSTPATAQVNLITSSNVVSINGPTTFCENDSVVLTSIFPGGNQWYKNGALIPGAVASIYIAKLSGYYQVRYTPAQGSPVFSDSIQVTVRLVPDFVIANADTACKGFTTTAMVQPQAGITFNWFNTPSGGISLASGLTYTTPPINQNTSLYIELSNSFGCVRTNRFEVVAMVHPQPVAQFTNSIPASTGTGFEISFENISQLGSSYLWDFGDPLSSDNTSSVLNPTHIYANPGTYITKLIVSNDYGCTDTISKVITVMLNNNIYIPTGFTPNNDGNNDVFRVRGNNIKSSNINIFNQWGQKIWFAENETTGWDGTMNGQIVSNGNYAYAIEVTFENGITQMYRGNISVIR